MTIRGFAVACLVCIAALVALLIGPFEPSTELVILSVLVLALLLDFRNW